MFQKTRLYSLMKCLLVNTLGEVNWLNDVAGSRRPYAGTENIIFEIFNLTGDYVDLWPLWGVGTLTWGTNQLIDTTKITEIAAMGDLTKGHVEIIDLSSVNITSLANCPNHLRCTMKQSNATLA